jgi:hypothetical protein
LSKTDSALIETAFTGDCRVTTDRRIASNMLDALDLQVTSLHCVAMAGVSLQGCETPGDQARLSVEDDMVIGARKAPTREEQLTPEERAKRKLKKANKKEKSVPASSDGGL